MKKITIIFLCFYLFSCNNDTKPEIKKVEVKQAQNVNAEVLKLLAQIYSTNTNDTLLILNKDSLITFPFFKSVKASSIVFNLNWLINILQIY